MDLLFSVTSYLQLLNPFKLKRSEKAQRNHSKHTTAFTEMKKVDTYFEPAH